MKHSEGKRGRLKFWTILGIAYLIVMNIFLILIERDCCTRLDESFVCANCVTIFNVSGLLAYNVYCLPAWALFLISVFKKEEEK